MFSAVLDANGKLIRDDAGAALFPWWSFTKTAIATLCLQAADQGAWDLDARLPDQPYSLAQLLQHRAGLRDYGPLPAYQAAVAAGAPPWPVDRLLHEARANDLAYTPGQGWNYSNIGYLILRQKLEQLHTGPLADILATQLLTPLGLDARLAETPEDFANLQWDTAGYHPGWVYHGCLVGTARDAATLLHTILYGGLLSRKSRRMMITPAMEGPAIPGRVWSGIGYGMGMMLGTAPLLGRSFGHAGCGPFSANHIGHFPDSEAQLTVATFCQGGNEAPAEYEAVAVATPRPQ